MFHPRPIQPRQFALSSFAGGMLEFRPTCENCNLALPPASPDARICSYECTFCATCAEGALFNVCPNCGGGFTPRPVRPVRNWKGNNHLAADPASMAAAAAMKNGLASRTSERLS